MVTQTEQINEKANGLDTQPNEQVLDIMSSLMRLWLGTTAKVSTRKSPAFERQMPVNTIV